MVPLSEPTGAVVMNRADDGMLDRALVGRRTDRRDIKLDFDAKIREAHVWFDGGNGPMVRPRETPPERSTLDFNLWLGPPPQRPYNPPYLPPSWRGWHAFGNGIVGDCGCHTASILFRALHLE